MPPWPDRFAATPQDRDAVLRLSAMHGASPKKLFELANEVGTATRCVQAILRGRLVGDDDRERLAAADVGELRARVEACGARVVGPGDVEYPSSLHDLADPPCVLFVRGNRLDELVPRIAIVGARNATHLGKDVAKSIGRELAISGVVVVSGGARGIDRLSHEGALAGGGRTIAVLGSGIDVAYPRSSGPLFARIESDGALVSEYPPGVHAEPFRFPARNRIVASLGAGVVVVEGAAGSGSLITVNHAVDLSRPVYAVPGAVNNPLAHVPLELIREGATMIRGADDLLQELGRLDPAGQRSGAALGLTVAEEAVFEELTGPTMPEHVAQRLGWSLPDVLSALVGLELRGLVRGVAGRFERRLPSA